MKGPLGLFEDALESTPCYEPRLGSEFFGGSSTLSVLKTTFFDRMFGWFLSTIRRKLFTNLKLIWVTRPCAIEKGNSNTWDQLKKIFFVWSFPFWVPNSISMGYLHKDQLDVFSWSPGPNFGGGRSAGFIWNQLISSILDRSNGFSSDLTS